MIQCSSFHRIDYVRRRSIQIAKYLGIRVNVLNRCHSSRVQSPLCSIYCRVCLLIQYYNMRFIWEAGSGKTRGGQAILGQIGVEPQLMSSKLSPTTDRSTKS